MNLADITTKCYILALIIRDDGERLLLGDGAYEFKDSQQHFIANTYANDVVELQGTDGQMLAGQVRRTAVQTFAGYIGDATFSKQKVEEARRDFMMFFRKKHYYTAVYVFSDGTAIQRKRGYIVNAPSVPELYQRFPEWSIGLNFEDPNYYEYAEDDLGQEIAAHKVELELSTAMSGGLIWDEDGAVSDDLSYIGTEIEGEGKNFQLAATGTATLKSAELLGDATQTTYSGKNLLPNTLATGTTNGLTYTVHSDGTITLTGRATARVEPYLYNNSNAPLTFPAGTYKNTSSYPIILYAGGYNLFPAGGSLTFSETKSVTQAYFRVEYTGTTLNETYYPQIIASTTADETYEPYVGGTASPNPDYPQPVNTVTGEQTVKIEGKNLLDVSKVLTNGNNTLVNNGNGSLTVKGLAVSGATPNTLADYCPTLKVGDVATLSATTTATANKFIYLYGANQSWAFGASKTITQAMLESRVAFYSSSGTGEDTISNIQLELGSTATTYEPYQAQEFEVNLGKNLLGLQNTSTMQQNGVTISVQDGTISLSGTASVSFGVIVANLSEDLRLTNGIDYAISMKTISGSTSRNFDVQLRDESDTNIFSINSDYFPVSRNTLSGVGKKLRLYFAYGTTFTNCKIAFQLELGTQATSYSAYFTPIELCKIGNYQDRIYKTDGKWYIEKQVGKVVLNGSETWTKTNLAFQTVASTTPNFLLWSDMTALSNNFTHHYYASGITSNIQNGEFGWSGAYLLTMRYDTCSTASDFKTWLGTHNTTVYYALATPTTTEITNSELVGQLERLKHAHTYADTTNFSVTATSPNLPAFLKVVAFGDDAIPQGGYVWEDGGTGGATTITVDGVDNAQPIWTVVGPATNPSLTNITTGESIQWTGVVPNGQALVVNMADMTASLSGANVFEFISGSWITLQAGNNRVSYSATAATGIATLEWNGVVG